MNPASILNDVLGPVMRGPSSSHTAAPFFIGTIARALLGEEPASVTFVFDPKDHSHRSIASREATSVLPPDLWLAYHRRAILSGA